ncbi:MAG TPA: type II toxin-antitoxin system VapC family toxin [Allosphingosinicella sp.]|nr:type II toxin-antitoxin system VapC family toxin [Allosphingosinicella sp.]
MRYSLDTNAVIGLMEGKPPTLRDRVRSLRHEDAVISTVVLHELVWGAHKSQRVEKNLERLGRLRLPIVEFGREDAYAAGQIRADLHRKGTPIGPYDLLIAGQARARGLTVVTGNVREYGRIEGLEVEDWGS